MTIAATEIPGLFDLQVNGFAGIDFNAADLTPDRVAEALEHMRGTGVTRCLPTLITSSFDAFAASARAIARTPAAAVAGIHMEGPYLSPEDGPRGAHPREHVREATVDDFRRRQDAADGRIILVTLAPEVAGALTLIEHLAADGVRVAIGHSAAAPGVIRDAVAAGATLSTHLGNGCAQLLPRHPNIIWELLANDAVHASFIADGHHLPDSTLKAMVRAKGLDRTILVTDAVSAAAAKPGRYTLGSVSCERDDRGRISLTGTPYLAGSALTLDRAIVNAVRAAGLPFDAAARMASTVPASYMGMATRGTITVEWDEEARDLQVRAVRTAG